MRLDKTQLECCRRAAIAAVRTAGAYVATARPLSITRKSADTGGGESEASRILTEVDRRSQSLILEALEHVSASFELGVLSEELEDDGGRHTASHFWCIDPLDGTLPFVEAVPGYAVSVALVRRDGTPVVGAVFDPCTGRLFDAAGGCGARLDGESWTAPRRADDGRFHLFCDRSFAQGPLFDATVAALRRVATASGCDDVCIHHGAGAVMNACEALLHAPACYLKFPKPTRGGGSVWDFAATACLAVELGGAASNIKGDVLALNPGGSTFMNEHGVLFATDSGLALRVREATALLEGLRG